MTKARRTRSGGAAPPKPIPVRLTRRQVALVAEVVQLTNRSQAAVLRAAVECLVEWLRPLDDAQKMKVLTEWTRLERQQNEGIAQHNEDPTQKPKTHNHRANHG